MNKINKIIKSHKNLYILVVSIVILALVLGIPTLGKLKHRNSVYSASSWDGTVASTYKSGTGKEYDPYIISTASEFAYFIEELKSKNYAGEYFELSNDIIINSGLFNYDEAEGLKYKLDDKEYYLDENTNKYYDNKTKEGEYIGEVYSLDSIENFKGYLNGNSYSIFGLYLSDFENEDLSFIKTLTGDSINPTLKDLYFTNSVVYGIGNVAGIAVNSENAIIENVVYNGFVLNKNKTKEYINQLKDVSILSNKGETKTSINLPNISVPGKINVVKIRGEWLGENDSIDSMIIQTANLNFEIDLSKTTFEIDLGDDLLNEFFVLTKSTKDGNSIEITNLEYVVEYYDQLSAGVIANSTNTSLINVINKSNVFGNYISSGIIGQVNGDLNISRAYNVGTISSSYISSGIIGEIKNNSNQVSIINSYNNGVILSPKSSGIIGTLTNNSGIINLTGLINITDTYAINTLNNSNLNIDKCYSLNGLTVLDGIITNSFYQKKDSELYEKEFLLSIGYNEFSGIDKLDTNNSNVWIYENQSMPILYIDDLTKPVANININKYSWNNLSSQLDIIEIPLNFSFNIEGVSATNPVTKIYYYVTDSRVALTKTDLDNLDEWNDYKKTVTIEESGYYTIYAKIIDSLGNIVYINTDIIMLNASGFKTTITLDDRVWESFKTELSDIYINKNLNLTIFAQNDLNPISSIEYYISNRVLTETDLRKLSEWVSYVSPISIKELGKYIVYAKIVDANSNIKYINTDWLIYNGYTELLSIGNKKHQYETNYITNKSTINLNFDSNFEINYKEGYSHNLVSSILLPKGTKLTLKDKINNKIYSLTISSDDDLYEYNNSCVSKTDCIKHATYSFNEFKEVGTKNKQNYDESINYGKIISNEKYSITIDFEKTSITENYYDVSFYLVIKDDKASDLYGTLDDSISNISVYSNINDLEITTTNKLLNDYSNQIINYNSNSENVINFTNQLIYSNINEKFIIDTTYENMKNGLLIGLYNEENKLVDKKYLNSMLFELNGKEYYSNSNGLININLGNATDLDIKTLKIKTRENSNKLPAGSYYLKINNFVSKDGYYYNNLKSEELIIPVAMENNIKYIPNYNFYVEMDGTAKILDNNLKSRQVNFSILYNGELTNANIRISLYEKKKFSAYDQEYNFIDIKEYISDELIESSSKQYYINLTNNMFNLNIMPNKFKNNGYKYVFELYDGNQKIDEVEQYFIVK